MTIRRFEGIKETHKMMIRHLRRTPWTLAVLLGCLSVSLFCVLYPIYVIRPFRAQGAAELEAALAVTRFRPLITIVSAGLALAAAVRYWRVQSKNWRRLLVASAAAVVGLLGILARVNVTELMFHPVDRPAFSAASQVKLDPDEKVIAVNIAGRARAYPVRSLSYHHVVNDVVAARAIVATY
jgi:hypothetical protein